MNYLARPVFEFAIDWSQSVNKPFAFNLRPVELGFGAPSFTSLQAHTVQGFDITVDLRTPDNISEFDAFTAALTGRLVGFWLPSPFEAMRIVNVVDTTHFDVHDQQLAETWEDHPDQHLFFSRAGQTSVPAKVTAVADLGNGYERITIDTAVAFLELETKVRKLHYVRLADDTERARFEAEGWQRRSLPVVELPLEYAQAETGEKKIYLYHFWFAPPVDVHWYFTSFAADVASNNVLYVAPKPGTVNGGIQHGNRRNGIKGDDALEISCAWHADHPFALFFPVPIAAPLNVQVLETTYGEPDTATAIFTGRVGPPRDRGDQLTAKCESFGAILKRKFPRANIQPGCNNQLFDAGCKLESWLFLTTATIVSVDSAAYPPTCVVTLNTPTAERQAEDYFAQGWIETGAGVEFEIRTILASEYDDGTGETTLTLNIGLLHAEPGQVVQLAPGCDGLAATCQTKFDNFINFGGFISLQETNLSLKTTGFTTTEGGKK